MKEKRDWRSVLDAFEVSGLTQPEFCRRHNIVLATFKHHRYLLRKTAAPAGFSQLSVSAPGPVPAVVELHFPDGLFLRFAGDVGTGYLRDLIAGLRP